MDYYPPDFNPAGTKYAGDTKSVIVRTRFPMTVRCSSCDVCTAKGTNCRTRKETVDGQTYLGCQIFRFYFKCPSCSSKIIMRTDPQNTDFVLESGATAMPCLPWG